MPWIHFHNDFCEVLLKLQASCYERTVYFGNPGVSAWMLQQHNDKGQGYTIFCPLTWGKNPTCHEISLRNFWTQQKDSSQDKWPNRTWKICWAPLHIPEVCRTLYTTWAKITALCWSPVKNKPKQTIMHFTWWYHDICLTASIIVLVVFNLKFNQVHFSHTHQKCLCFTMFTDLVPIIR